MNLTIAPGPDGVVRIGPEPLAASYVAEVDLPGVTVLVDPTSPEPAAHALVHDPVEAEPHVASLFGSDVARAVQRGEPATVPSEASAELIEVERLGWLSWLDRYRPIPLDDRMLDLERLVARAGLPGHEQEIETSENVAALLTLARRLRENPQLPLAGRLRELLRAAFLHLPVADDDQPLVAHERELLNIADQWGSDSLTSGDLRWLAEQVTPVPAGHLGGGSVLAGRATLDWRRVPRRLLPAAEETVSFDVAAGRVNVTVGAPLPVERHPALARTPEPAPQLVASLRSSTWPLPLAQGALEFDRLARTWHGSFLIVPAAVELAEQAEFLDVDVRARVLGWVAPNRAWARESAARRWSARGVAVRRLAAARPGGPLGAAAGAALRFSARLWSAGGHRDRAERCLALAREPWRGTWLSLAEEWLLVSEGGAPAWAPSAGV